MKKFAALLITLLLCLFLVGTGFAVSFADYDSAYNMLNTNGGVDANVTLDMTMNGQAYKATGNITIDWKNQRQSFTLTMDGNTFSQYRDGNTLLTVDVEGNVSAMSLEEHYNSDPYAPRFSVSNFVSDFSTFLDIKRLRDIGLLYRFPSGGVVNITENSDVYTLTVSEDMISVYTGTLSDYLMDKGYIGSGVTFSLLRNVTYTATVKTIDGNPCITKITFGADFDVNVPAAVNSTSDASYQMSFTMAFDFNNPGQAVTVATPSW